jgi:hypothetical protein
MKLSSFVGIGFATLLTASLLNGCGGGNRQNMVAKVGDTPIDREMYIRRLELMPTPVQIGRQPSDHCPRRLYASQADDWRASAACHGERGRRAAD